MLLPFRSVLYANGGVNLKKELRFIQTDSWLTWINLRKLTTTFDEHQSTFIKHSP